MAGPNGLPDSHLLAWVLVAPWKSTITKVTLIGPYLKLQGLCGIRRNRNAKGSGTLIFLSIRFLSPAQVHSLIHSFTHLTHSHRPEVIHLRTSFVHSRICECVDAFLPSLVHA